ncbi:MAG: hypothetical protein ACRDS0_20275 [Pseudonocardiaceae bacterium]
MSAPGELVPRRIAAALDAAMPVSPVVAITGARTAGKTTLARADHRPHRRNVHRPG